jgi:hypothetical protein
MKGGRKDGPSEGRHATHPGESRVGAKSAAQEA